jgi:hypothetical protein
MGVTPQRKAGYNNLGMIPDAPPESKIKFARVLASLPGVPAPLSGSFAIAGAS